MQRILFLALMIAPVAACSGSAAEAEPGAETEQAAGTPLPAVDDQAEIERIAATLSDEGDYPDRKMFTGFMFGKKLLESGALKTRDKDRYSETTVETAIAAERARKVARDERSAKIAQRRDSGDLTLARADCKQMKDGIDGRPVLYPMGYSFRGRKYPDPCTALADGSE
ncbi:hypothetical protein [Citromicrobium bathyomarinum]|uniref:hypothetical protein n=1 Tax=Citromicrobium bathyomarinum TaxID=72174 RepID=UPI00315B03E5